MLKWLPLALPLFALLPIEPPADDVSCPSLNSVFIADNDLGENRGRGTKVDGWDVTGQVRARAEYFILASFDAPKDALWGNQDTLMCLYGNGHTGLEAAVTIAYTREFPRGACKPAGWDVNNDDGFSTSYLQKDLAKAVVSCS